MIILCPSLAYKSFSNFYQEMLFVNNLYTKTSFCSDHEVAPKVIIRLKMLFKLCHGMLSILIYCSKKIYKTL